MEVHVDHFTLLRTILVHLKKGIWLKDNLVEVVSARYVGEKPRKAVETVPVPKEIHRRDRPVETCSTWHIRSRRARII